MHNNTKETDRHLLLLLCSVKNGKVVVLLNGRFAGRKAIVVKTFDEGKGDRKFGHAIGTDDSDTDSLRTNWQKIEI